MRQFQACDVVLPTRSEATTRKTWAPSMGAGTVAVYGDVHATAGAASSWQVKVTGKAGSSGSVAEKLNTAVPALVIVGGVLLKAKVGGVPST